MNLISPANIKTLLNKYGAKPSKNLGQNFLIDKNVLDKIIKTADLKPDDAVLEIGPGIGTLTQKLAKHAKKVIAIEKDKTMVEILKETLVNYKNIEIIQGDILKIDVADLSLRGRNNGRSNLKIQIASSACEPPRNDEIKNYKIVANIPYYITSPVIRKFLEAENQPESMVLMMQKEVAQRICGKPPDMTLLSASVQFYAEPKIISYVSKNCFWPSPKVDSAIIKIVPRYLPRDPISHETVRGRGSHELFFKIVKAGFSQPRKQLAGNLSTKLNLTKEKTADWLVKNNIKPTQRAETLSIEDWKNLTNSIQ